MQKKTNGIKLQLNQKDMLLFLLRYTLCFIAIWGVSHIVFFVCGKTILSWDDCLTAYYEAEPFKTKVLWTLLHGKSAWTNYNLFGDYTISALNGMDLFDLVWLFIPKKHAEIVYIIMTVFRSFVAGLFAAILFKYKKISKEYILPACMIYILYGFILLNELRQPVFSPMYVYLPLLLLGMERLIKENKGLLFSVFLGLFFLLSVWECYFVTLGMVMYFPIILFENKMKIKDMLTAFGKVAMYYLLGILLGMPFGLSAVTEILSTPRLGTEGTEITFSLGEFFTGLFSQIGHLFLVGEDFVGISALVLFPLLYLLITKSKKRVYLIMLFVMMVIMNISIFPQILGETIATNRGSFVFGMIAAILFAVTLPDMKNNITKKKMIILHGIIILLLGISVAFLWKEGIRAVIMLVIVFTVSTALYDVFFLIKAKETLKAKEKRLPGMLCIYGILAVSAIVSGWYAFTVTYDVKNKCIEYGTVNFTLNQAPASAAERVLSEDTSFYRVDEAAFSDEIKCNLNYWYAYNGFSAFVPLLNPATIEYCKVMESTALGQINKSQSFGGKISDETLACTKYFLWNRINPGEIPYGFEYKYSEPSADIYANTAPTSMILFYKDTISENRFEALNIAEKEEIILKKIVTEEGTGELPKLQSRMLGYSVSELNNLTEEEGKLRIKGKDAFITLLIEEPEVNGELYVELSASIPDSGNHTIDVSNGTGFDSAKVGGEIYIRKNQQSAFCFNLGNYSLLDENERLVNISIPRGKGMIISDIHVYCRDLSTYEEDVENLHHFVVENESIEWDNISAKVTTGEDGFLFFSVPYRKGWKCFVDGKRVDLFKANIMYTGISIPEGEHEVRLKYVPMSFYLGLGMAVLSAGILCLFQFVNAGRKQKNKAAEE